MYIQQIQKNKFMDDSIFIKCKCGECNLLEINFDGEEFYCSMWVNEISSTKPMSKQERIRWCDHIMKTGRPWADHTIISKKDAQRIVNFITKHIKTKK